METKIDWLKVKEATGYEMNDNQIQLSDNQYGSKKYPAIYFFTENNGVKVLQFSVKNITTEWAISQITKLDSKTLYTYLAPTFAKIGLKHSSIYYTSFGISLCTFLKSREEFDADAAIIENKLKELDLEYRCEFSAAFWVYRFRISQSKKSLDKIKAIA
jgi:hypothetical protein